MKAKEIQTKIGRSKEAILVIRNQEIKAYNIRFLPSAIGFYADGKGEYRERYTDIQEIK